MSGLIDCFVNEIHSYIHREFIEPFETCLKLINLIVIELFRNIVSNFDLIPRSEELLFRSDRWVRKKVDLEGKTILVTNCNDVLGSELILELFKRGAVVIGCHNRPGEEHESNDVVRQRIELGLRNRRLPLTGNDVVTSLDSPGSDSQRRVIVQRLDLSSFHAVGTFVDKLLLSGMKLNCIINNQDVLIVDPQVESIHGLDFLHQINYYSPFYLMSKLYHHLSQSSNSPVSSQDSFQDEKKNSSRNHPILINFTSEIYANYSRGVHLEGGLIIDTNFWFNYSRTKSATAIATKESVDKLSPFNFRIYLIETGFKALDKKHFCCQQHSSQVLNGGQESDGVESSGQESIGGIFSKYKNELKSVLWRKLTKIFFKFYHKVKCHVTRKPAGIVNHVLLALSNEKDYDCNKFVIR